LPWSGTLPTIAAGEHTPASEFTTMLDALHALSDAWTSWTPTLTASTTPPTLGTGGTTSGSYIQVGKLAIARWRVVFGTSGTNAGSGTYSITGLPADSVTTSGNVVLGVVRLRDNSVPLTNAAFAMPVTATQFSFQQHGGNIVTEAAPWAWAANDSLSGILVWEVA